jgi:LMBR1 domain-containing protein 1
MQVGGTYVSSFLFNLGIVLLCTIPLIHFCVVAFAGYTVNSDAFLLFGVQVNYLTFYSQFYTNHVFVWILMLSALSVLPYFFIRPRDKAVSTEDFKKHLAERAAKSGGTGGYTSLSRKGGAKDLEMGSIYKNKK